MRRIALAFALASSGMAISAAPTLELYDANGPTGLTVIGGDAFQLVVRSPQGYLSEVDAEGDVGTGGYYTYVWRDDGCSDGPYLPMASTAGGHVPGVVTWGTPQLHYVPLGGATVLTLQEETVLYGSGCQPWTYPAGTQFQQLLTNDPAVTGIPNTLVPPVRQVLTEEGAGGKCVFANGFECAAP